MLAICFGWATCASGQSEWPRFLGRNFDGTATTSPNNSDSPSVSATEFDWTVPPTYVWSAQVGPGYGLGSVANGHYYHFDATDGRAAPKSERLTARRLDSGKLIWSVQQPLKYRDLFGYEEGPRSTPTIDDQQIFTLGVSGQLTCRNIDNGVLTWTINTSEKFGVVQNFFGVGSSPLVIGDSVIVMIGGSPDEDQKVAPMQLDRVSSNGSALVAFDRDNGQELWRCGSDLASYSSPRTISVGGKDFLLAFAREGLMMIDPTDGSEAWRYDHRASMLESVNAMMPVVQGDEVFISECYQVGSVLLKAGANSREVVWVDPPGDRRRQAMRSHWATPVLVDEYLYGCSGRNAPDSDLRCIDWHTGEVKWTDSRRIRSSLTRVGNHLIVLEERGRAEVIRATPAKMDVVATWPLDKPEGNRPALEFPCWAAPIVVDDRMIVRGDDQVVCLKLPR